MEVGGWVCWGGVDLILCGTGVRGGHIPGWEGWSIFKTCPKSICHKPTHCPGFTSTKREFSVDKTSGENITSMLNGWSETSKLATF